MSSTFVIFFVQQRTSCIQQALVYVGAHDLARGADPLAEDSQPPESSAADVQGAQT